MILGTSDLRKIRISKVGTTAPTTHFRIFLIDVHRYPLILTR